MRTQDKRVFAEVASDLKLWILVRDINPASEKYIAQRGYHPKRIDCKAKTADRDSLGRQVAGLVVDPTIHRQAFLGDKLTKALPCWQAFLEHVGAAGSEQLEARRKHGECEYGVDLDPGSRHYGVVTLKGEHVYGDYDLKDIIIPGHEIRNWGIEDTLHGVTHTRSPRLAQVQQRVNRMIGCAIVQHGPEMPYADHTEDRVLVFGPDGQTDDLDGLASIRQWYAKQTATKLGEGRTGIRGGPASVMVLKGGGQGGGPAPNPALFRVIPGGRR